MAGAKALGLWLALAILAGNPLQAVAKCSRKCITPCFSTCCTTNDTPCTFYASPLGQNITISNACMSVQDPRAKSVPWW